LSLKGMNVRAEASDAPNARQVMDRPHADAPVVTHRSVLAIALPMTLAYVTTPLLGLVDTAVVGQFGEAALIGGLAAGALVFDVVFTTFNFLRAGTTGLVAQAMGRGDAAGQQAVFWRAAILAVLCGLLLLVVTPLAIVLGERFLGLEPAAADAMRTYVGIRMFGAPLTLLNYAILGYVLGRGEAGLGLMLQAVLNGVNILLSVLLGLHLGWGVPGVAWGTVAGEAVAVTLGLIILARRFSRQPRLSRAQIFDVPAFIRMLALNRDIMIRSFTLLAAFALFTRGGAELGTVTLAANAVLMNFFMVGAFFLDGFATAAEQLAGRSYGARSQAAFRRSVNLTTIWAFAVSLAATFAFLAGGTALVAVLTTAEDVRATAALYLPWAAFTILSGA